MARLSVFYDESIKERVFKLRGDEGYARATSIVFGVGNPSVAEYNFSVSVTVDVLRDVGEGNIAIYDNDNLVYLIDDWTSTSGERTITLTGLDFDVQHNLYARYMGNNKCLPSTSKTYQVLVEDTHRLVPTLTFTSDTVQFDPNTPITNTVTLTNEGAIDYTANQDISIYYDDTFVTTVNTDDSTSFTIPDCGDSGLHTIQAVYGGSNNLTEKILTVPVSIGYYIEWREYEQRMVYDRTPNYRGRIMDWFDNRAPISVPCNLINGRDEIGILRTVNSNSGSITFTPPTLDPTIDSYAGIATNNPIYIETTINGVTYTSEEIMCMYIRLYNLNITSTSPVFVKDEENIVSADIGLNIDNVKVRFWWRDADNILQSKYKRTNGDGVAQFVLPEFITPYHVDCGFVAKTLSFTEYIQYWDPSNNIQSQFKHQIHNGGLITKSNGFQLEGLNGQSQVFLAFNALPTFELVIEGVTTNQGVEIGSIYSQWSMAAGVRLTRRTYNNAKIIIKREHEDEDVTIQAYNGSTLIESKADSITNPSVIGFCFDGVYGTALKDFKFSKLSLREL